MQTKLTLRLDAELIRRAKRQARKSGKSVSEIVADYFAALSVRPEEEPLTPLVRSMKGVLKGTDIDASQYHKHLERKYV